SMFPPPAGDHQYLPPAGAAVARKPCAAHRPWGRLARPARAQPPGPAATARAGNAGAAQAASPVPTPAPDLASMDDQPTSVHGPLGATRQVRRGGLLCGPPPFEPRSVTPGQPDPRRSDQSITVGPSR